MKTTQKSALPHDQVKQGQKIDVKGIDEVRAVSQSLSGNDLPGQFVVVRAVQGQLFEKRAIHRLGKEEKANGQGHCEEKEDGKQVPSCSRVEENFSLFQIALPFSRRRILQEICQEAPSSEWP